MLARRQCIIFLTSRSTTRDKINSIVEWAFMIKLGAKLATASRAKAARNNTNRNRCLDMAATLPP